MTDNRPFTEDLSKTARDAAYVAVGLGVLGFQRAQVRRRELAKRLAAAGSVLQQQIDRLGDLTVTGSVLQRQVDRLGEVPTDLATALADIDDALEAVIARIEALVEPLEDRLPPPARDAVKQARTQARATRRQIHDRIRRSAA